MTPGCILPGGAGRGAWRPRPRAQAPAPASHEQLLSFPPSQPERTECMRCPPLPPGRPLISGAKQRGTSLGGAGRRGLPSLHQPPRLWACAGELAFSALRETVWFGAWFHFTTKMSDSPPPSPFSLNKGGSFGFHNSDHLTPSWNAHGEAGHKAVLLSWATFGSGAMPTSTSPLPRPVAV